MEGIDMPRRISESEMKRRQLMAAAKSSLTDAMMQHSLTALEWINVLHEQMQRMIGHGLVEEFEDDQKAAALIRAGVAEREKSDKADKRE